MPTKRPRDSQRSKLYQAENILSGCGLLFDTTGEIQAYVDHLVGLRWFQRRWPLSSIEVRDGRGRTSACGAAYRRGGAYCGYIKMPRWSRTEPVVLHEIAHCCARVDGLRNGAIYAAHGWQFARVLLELVRHRMGDDDWSTLRDSFRESHVRYKQPRRLSPAARAAAAQRLKRGRQQAVLEAARTHD